MEKLKKLRDEIDDIDKKIVELKKKIIFPFLTLKEKKN